MVCQVQSVLREKLLGGSVRSLGPPPRAERGAGCGWGGRRAWRTEDER